MDPLDMLRSNTEPLTRYFDRVTIFFGSRVSKLWQRMIGGLLHPASDNKPEIFLIALCCATEGWAGLLDGILERGLPRNQDRGEQGALYAAAASAGKVECMKCIERRGFPTPCSVILHAACNGHEEVVGYMVERAVRIIDHPQETTKKSDRHHALGIIRLWTHHLCSFAAFSGKPDALKKLHEMGAPWSADTFAQASLSGSIECLHYLFDNGCPLNSKAALNAFKSDFYECLILLHKRGAPGSQRYISKELKNENETILRYSETMDKISVRENGPLPSSKKTHVDFPSCHKSCLEEPEQGHAAWLKYSVTETLYESEEILMNAAKADHLECFRPLYSLLQVFRNMAALEAAKHGSLRCLIFAHECGIYNKGDVVRAAASHHRIHCLRFLVEHGYPQENAVEASVKSQSIDCLQYLLERGSRASSGAVSVARIYGVLPKDFIQEEEPETKRLRTMEEVKEYFM